MSLSMAQQSVNVLSEATGTIKRRGVSSSLRIHPPAPFPQIALPLPDSDTSTLSSADSDRPPFHNKKMSSSKNMKKLSLTLPSAHSSVQSLYLPSADTAPTREKPRRPSIISLPAATLLHRRDEDLGSPVPYADGPVQVIPGIWIGSEDNARDWKCLMKRGIRSILNVAKEVSSPFDSFSASQALRSVTSTPNFRDRADLDPTYYPPHVPSGRPGMHCLKLDWSHGQQDLVNHGFRDGMAFVDAALDRGEGCLIHCQCGISRSATMVIALVMRAAAERLPSVPPEIWALQGMQPAYDYVKEKSPCVGPNMSLIYQLRDYEKILKRGTEPSPHDSDVSSIAEDEEEWTRRRRLLDEAPDNEPNERESVFVMQEAKALDKAMEDRVVARKSSASSMSSIASSSGFGMGSTWRSHFPRKRKGSTTSNNTTGSSLSETLVEEEEERELLGIGGGFDNDSHQSQTEEDSSLGSCSPDDDQKGTPRNVSVLNSNLETLNPPASLAWKATPFPSGPPLTAIRSTFDISPPRPSPPKPRVKRRPVSLSILPPVPASPINLVLESDGGVSRGNHSTYQDDNAHIPSRFPHPPTRRRSESRLLHPSSLRHSVLLQKGSSGSVSTRSSSSDSVLSVCASQTQTLIVFPPSPTTTPKNPRTPVPAPSTMTLLSNPSGPVAFPSLSMLQTPLVSTFNGTYSSGNTTSAATTTKAKRRSFIGLTTPSTPTVGLAKVDARGYVGFEILNPSP